MDVAPIFALAESLIARLGQADAERYAAEMADEAVLLRDPEAALRWLATSAAVETLAELPAPVAG